MSEAAVPTVIIITSDQKRFSVKSEIIEKSTVLKNLIDDINPDGLTEDFEVPALEVSSPVLTNIIKWLKYHEHSVFPDEEDDDYASNVPVEEWDRNFFRVESDMLYNIIVGANYLGIRPLKDCGCKIVAEMIKGRTPEELKKIFKFNTDGSATK